MPGPRGEPPAAGAPISDAEKQLLRDHELRCSCSAPASITGDVSRGGGSGQTGDSPEEWGTGWCSVEGVRRTEGDGEGWELREAEKLVANYAFGAFI